LSGRVAFRVLSRRCRAPTAPCPDYSPGTFDAIREAAGQSRPNSEDETGHDATGTKRRAN
jgi:hypothetical protein